MGLLTDLLGDGNGTLVGAKAVRSSTQSVPTATNTAIEFNAADAWDSDGFHDTATNNTRITIPTGKAGIYRITGQVSRLTADATGRRLCFIQKNGSDIIAREDQTPSSVVTTSMSISGVDNAAEGDYYEFVVFQDSGSSLTVNTPLHLSAERLGADPT